MVTLTPLAESDEVAPWTASPGDPAPLVVTVAPVSCTPPPLYATTPSASTAASPGALVPLVEMVVGPRALALTMVIPPFSEKIPSAPAPDVAIEPPRIVVTPPVLVTTPCISMPCVEIDTSVSFATPPAGKLPNGPL